MFPVTTVVLFQLFRFHYDSISPGVDAAEIWLSDVGALAVSCVSVLRAVSKDRIEY